MDSILLEIIPPRQKSGSYSIGELTELLRLKVDQIESEQKSLNDSFDDVLRDPVLKRLEVLRSNLHTLQLDMMKLQCDLAFSKEQLETMRITCSHPAISQRQALLEKERQLKKSIRQLKFEPLREFFSRLIKHLESTVDSCKRICNQQVVNNFQLFDWNLFQQTVLLLRICGKALIDVQNSESLYQSSLGIIEISFKQPLAQVDFNHFVESYDQYSFETLVEVVVDTNRRLEFKEIVSNIESYLPAGSSSLFEKIHSDLKSVTVGCCKLLIDLNMNYIDNLLTEGISIDKLNGNDNSSSPSQSDSQPLPMYAFSPQEYITQIGQHLLTLRKQTQQFDSVENGSLRCALGFLEQAQDIPIDVKSYATVTEIVMRCMVRHCIRSLLARTNKSILTKLTLNGRRQLSTDALYLDNVLEDLSLLDSSEPNADRFKRLLVQ